MRRTKAIRRMQKEAGNVAHLVEGFAYYTVLSPIIWKLGLVVHTSYPSIQVDIGK